MVDQVRQYIQHAAMLAVRANELRDEPLPAAELRSDLLAIAREADRAFQASLGQLPDEAFQREVAGDVEAIFRAAALDVPETRQFLDEAAAQQRGPLRLAIAENRAVEPDRLRAQLVRELLQRVDEDQRGMPGEWKARLVARLVWALDRELKAAGKLMPADGRLEPYRRPQDRG